MQEEIRQWSEWQRYLEARMEEDRTEAVSIKSVVHYDSSSHFGMAVCPTARPRFTEGTQHVPLTMGGRGDTTLFHCTRHCILAVTACSDCGDFDSIWSYAVTGFDCIICCGTDPMLARSATTPRLPPYHFCVPLMPARLYRSAATPTRLWTALSWCHRWGRGIGKWGLMGGSLAGGDAYDDPDT